MAQTNWGSWKRRRAIPNIYLAPVRAVSLPHTSTQERRRKSRTEESTRRHRVTRRRAPNSSCERFDVSTPQSSRPPGSIRQFEPPTSSSCAPVDTFLQWVLHAFFIAEWSRRHFGRRLLRGSDYLQAGDRSFGVPETLSSAGSERTDGAPPPYVCRLGSCDVEA